jgi:hypothetical protein
MVAPAPEALAAPDSAWPFMSCRQSALMLGTSSRGLASGMSCPGECERGNYLPQNPSPFAAPTQHTPKTRLRAN